MTATLSPTGWHAGFLSILPAIETHAKIRFRKLPAERREDAIQETISAACVNYQLLAARGRLDVAHPSTIADFAARHVTLGRHVGGRQDAAKDVMSPICQERHGVTVARFHPRPSGTGTAGWKQIAIEDRKSPIPDLAAFRIDFAEWLRTLTRRDRKIIGAFVSGERTSGVADRFGISAGRVSQLRRKFEREWFVFSGRRGISFRNAAIDSARWEGMRPIPSLEWLPPTGFRQRADPTLSLTAYASDDIIRVSLAIEVVERFSCSALDFSSGQSSSRSHAGRSGKVASVLRSPKLCSGEPTPD